MRNLLLFIITFSILGGCSVLGNNSSEIIEIPARFIHKIPGCENNSNLEINCTEFIYLSENSTADLLIGGGDIVVRSRYDIIANIILVKQTPGLPSDISFRIEDGKTLIRMEGKEIWKRDDIEK